jgi:hypothetical protein
MKAEIMVYTDKLIVNLVPAFCTIYGDYKYVENYGETFYYCKQKDIIRIILEKELFEI